VCKSEVHNISCEPACRNVGLFEVVSVDFCGPMSVPSLRQRRYGFIVIDLCSRFMRHDALRSKDNATSLFRRMLTAICSMGYTVCRLRVDNETVYLDASCRSLLDEFNIVFEVTALMRTKSMAGLYVIGVPCIRDTSCSSIEGLGAGNDTCGTHPQSRDKRGF
jgi:hypothetical protein